jgi:hypothetical protein
MNHGTNNTESLTRPNVAAGSWYGAGAMSMEVRYTY